MNNVRWLTGVAGIGLFLMTSQALAQGSLTPPGPPGPTMKTLDQVESRIAITNLPHLINSPGSYYLAQNLTGSTGNNGIVIADNSVTLDLNGFRLLSVAGSVDGIVVLGSRSGIVIRNGHVRNWGGIGVNAWNANNSRLEKLIVDGCASNGLVVGDRGIVAACTSIGNGAQGIRVGANGQVRECIAAQNDGGGIWTDDGCIIDNCTSSTNDEGVVAGTASIVRNCTVRDNAVDGIRVSHRCRVVDNVSEDNGGIGDGAGVHATGNGNRITGTHAIGADQGLDLDGAGNYVADNTVMGNADNYAIAAGNELNLLLCEIPQTIDWPCSVKFAGNLISALTRVGTHGIVVNADDVTIDMAGHTLTGPGTGSGSGIYQTNTFRNLRAYNGKVVDWKGTDEAGIQIRGDGAILENIQASSNYCGIIAWWGAMLHSCTALHNTDTGFCVGPIGTIRDCTALSNGDIGIFLSGEDTVIGCVARSNSGTGIFAAGANILRDCLACFNQSNGISAFGGSILTGCTSEWNQNHGIDLSGHVLVSGCIAQYNRGDGISSANGGSELLNNLCMENGDSDGDGAGIHVSGQGSRIEGNTVEGNDRGIDVDDGSNLIVRNWASSNTTDYAISAGNKVGTIQTSPVGAGAWDNFED